MCGIVGMAGHIDPNLKDVFKDMLFMDTLRGSHGTGIFTRKNYGNEKTGCEIVKYAMPAYDFLEMKKVIASFTPQVKCLIGHNRYATQGAHTARNSHPFNHGQLYGVHNGTLRKQELLPDHQQYEVDSDNIYHSLNKLGVIDTVPKLAGAYALVWWDELTGTLNMLRNSERPMAFALTKNGHTLIWSSEPGILAAAAHRRGVALQDLDELPINSHFMWEIDNVTGKGKPLPKPVTQVVQPYVAPVVSYVQKAVQGVTGTTSASTVGAKASPAKSAPSTFLKQQGLDMYEPHKVMIKAILGTAIVGHICNAKNTPVHIECYLTTTASRVFRELMDAGKKCTVGGLEGYRVDAADPTNRKKNYAVTSYMKILSPPDLLAGPGLEDEEVDEDYVVLKCDHKGNLIDRNEFDGRYNTCEYCGVTLDFDDEDFEPLTHDTGICGSCVHDGVLEDSMIGAV